MFCVVYQEMNVYLREPTVDPYSNPLDWWAVNSDRFPLLSLHAGRVLSLPATSVHSEQAFTTARIILTDLRNKLGGEKAEQLLFLNRILPQIGQYQLLK
jgi:hypothetical protein